MTIVDNDIKKWILLDNQIKLQTEKLKELRDTRADLSETIKNYIETNKIPNSTIKINDVKLKVFQTKIAETLTFKYLEQKLNEIIPNQNQVKQIVDYLKIKRSHKIVSEIKRLNV
jgi:polynucleotide 5'-kinase involved in rRNA processing